MYTNFHQSIGDIGMYVIEQREEKRKSAVQQAKVWSTEYLQGILLGFDTTRGYLRKTIHKILGEPLEIKTYRKVFDERETSLTENRSDFSGRV